VVRFDAHFSSVIERPNTADALRREATENLAAPEPWTWLAERDGELDAGGAAISLLHYAQLNPLSAPFWSQQGYRPLWSTWEARPARAIR
jgi:hypothetical protein